ncbi:MAG TPA: DUF5134 domain-containing protein [Microlunatus sp.]
MTPIALVIIVLFALSGGFFAVRMISSGGAHDRIFDASHVLMAAMMIIMAIGWSARVPAVLQLTVFTGFALWYVYLAMFRPYAVEALIEEAQIKKTSTGSRASAHHTGRPRLLYHAAMMMAMVWMAVIMAPVPAAGAMDMAMPGHPHGADSAASIPLHAWANPLSIMIGIAFAGAAVWYIARFVRFAGTRRVNDAHDVRRLTDLASAAVMAVGMALAFLVDIR